MDKTHIYWQLPGTILDISQRMLTIGVLVCVNVHVVIFAKEIHVGSQIV